MTTRLPWLRLALLVGLAGTLPVATACSPQEGLDVPVAPAESGARPNILVVVVDDLRWDEVGYVGHPYLETPNIDRLAREGVRFSQAVHAVPLCSPNRASILTGQYPSRHGIIDNVARNRMSHHLETFPQALQAAGYETAFLGKWHMGNDPTPRPGFDYWVAIPGQGRVNDPELYEDGRLHVVEGYITDVLTDRAVSFIEQDRDQPFLMYIGHKAVHPDTTQRDDGSVDPTELRAYVPAPRHRGRYEEAVFPRRPNVVSSPDGLTDKPALRRALTRKHSAEMEEMFGPALDHGTSEETIRRRAEMMLAVDDGLGRIMEALAAQGILDETLIVFTSDNGFFYGEHGLSSVERRMPYEEAIRMPLVMRYPALARAGEEVDALVVSVDIAPTALEAAGVPVGGHVQGRSLVPLLQGTAADWRESALIEFYTYENPWPWLVDMDYRAIRTRQFKYVHWMHYPDESELYDLRADPYETRNLIDEPDFAQVADELRAMLADAVLEAMGLGRR
jgi:N-acetylglucosamine-6-sulfatase